MNERFAIASRWLLRLQSDDIEPEEFSTWLSWYETDPLNRAAFEEAQASFESVRALSPEDRARFARRVDSRPQRAWFRWNYSLSFAAGALAVAVVGTLLWLVVPGQPAQVTATYQTPLATHRVEPLPDGSVVHLGARSSITVNFSGETRFIVLESGEALFSVAKDASRPFVVQAGAATVRALGTQFNVRRAGESTTVAVSEGTVQVADTHLKVGQVAVVSKPAEMPVVRNIDIGAVSAWQEGRLEFFNEPLPLVIATVNRYSSREIVVTDPSLGELRMTGSIDGRHIREWVRALPEIFPVKVNEIGKATVLVSPS